MMISDIFSLAQLDGLEQIGDRDDRRGPDLRDLGVAFGEGDEFGIGAGLECQFDLRGAGEERGVIGDRQGPCHTNGSGGVGGDAVGGSGFAWLVTGRNEMTRGGLWLRGTGFR